MRIIFHPKFNNDSFMEWIYDGLPEITDRGIVFDFRIANQAENEKFFKKKPKDEAVVILRGKGNTPIVGTSNIEEFIRKHPKIKKIQPQHREETYVDGNFNGRIDGFVCRDLNEDGSWKKESINILDYYIQQDAQGNFVGDEDEGGMDSKSDLTKAWEQQQREAEERKPDIPQPRRVGAPIKPQGTNLPQQNQQNQNQQQQQHQQRPVAKKNNTYQWGDDSDGDDAPTPMIHSYNEYDDNDQDNTQAQLHAQTMRLMRDGSADSPI
jgi:hypothetical protein